MVGVLGRILKFEYIFADNVGELTDADVNA
jgi:hypothetical protein